MAQRRMFSKDVTNSDEFLDMPLSSQALYFHLGINADDDGFIQPKGIMRLVQAKEDDLKVLKAKGFIIEFAGSVIVITHWKLNNSIRADRKKDTIFKEHLRNLGLDENGIYKEENGCQPNDNQMTTKCPHRLGKDRIVEDRLGKVNICEETSREKKPNEINEILNLFYETINPTISFANNTNRNSCDFLIKNFGFEKTKNAVEYAIRVQSEKYAPRITTPTQLKNKFAELQIYYKNNNKIIENICLD